ncbi:carbohydrate diacid transcriptional activator CdaR [uncultured Roseburia sp.]|uniref:Helix-turn-helix domain-containing protein n=1 Tax=Brotonthovivens ammoniilytica TaxID=2981725 RepID=A0ABT2TGZ6_9FIRM|nr:helix-turn-helix domain-containing protein [Brotonthovivens ammoniilytica]MCU6761468.1 helix-turn-helix domain-containing protein [Brotonthovivens ammoniilytica]SCI29336.1 carbohydrate diacid transcriptional activator CdaR [uncultured Roseburia sp.]
MKLSMWIFADWLKGYHPKLQIQSGKMEIETVRLFSQNNISKDNTLYIGRLSDFFPNNSGHHVVCSNRNDLIILPVNDIAEILNAVIEAIEFYSKWNTDILKLLSHGCLIPDLLKRSEKILKEPVFVLDSGQRLLAISSLYHDQYVDRYWHELAEYGSTNIDFILKFNQHYAKNLFQIRGVYLVNEDILPHKTYCYNFFLNNVWVGVTNILVQGESLSQGTLDLFTAFCHYIDMWFTSSPQQQSMLFLDSMFHFALSNQECDYENFNRHLKLLNWQFDDPKILITMVNTFEQYNIHTHLCHTINDLFPYAYALTHDSYVCVLCNLNQKELSFICQDIIPWLKKSNYYGCYSSPFTDLKLLSEHFEQTKIAAQFSPQNIGEMYHTQDYIMKYGFTVMKQHVQTTLIHAVVTQLEAYDLEHQTEFSHTLHMYLKYERSQSQTANALNLHRNTLTYRLKKLRELISCYLDNPDTRMNLLISYELLDNL